MKGLPAIALLPPVGEPDVDLLADGAVPMILELLREDLERRPTLHLAPKTRILNASTH